MENKISPAVWTRVRAGYAAVKPADLPADYNPVEKIALHVYEVESQLHIDELIVDHDMEDLGPADEPPADIPPANPPPGDGAVQRVQVERRRGVVPRAPPVPRAVLPRRRAVPVPRRAVPVPRAVRVSNQSQLQSLTIQVRNMNNRLQENHNQHQAAISTLQEYCGRRFGLISTNMTRYYMVPTRPLQNRNRNAANPQLPLQAAMQQQADLGVDRTARLSPHPRTLLALWHEYLHGLNGNKPAKDFTANERGKVKCKYSRRKTFWMTMGKLVRAGYSELAAIDRIKQSYGVNQSVTSIINSLIRDRRNPHPNLVI